MFKYVIQIIVGITILALSTFIAWYEGSAIKDIPREWKYSTPFSRLFNIEIVNGHDISQLDYFVYSAKYQPLFPVIMLISAYYILTVFGCYLLKYHSKWAIIFWGLMSCIILSFSIFIFNSLTVGGKIFFWSTLIIGIISIVVTVFVYFKNFKFKKSVGIK